MNVLVIYAHPNQNSFNHAILEELIRGIKDGNHLCQVIDLYKEGFNPILVYNDERKRSDLINDNETERYRELVRKANHIVFIYPIWWYGMPAILKGFIDRIFVSGFAYSNSGRIPKGLLGDKSAWVIYTIDSPSWFVKIFRRNVEWTVMKNAVLGYCGIRHSKRLMFANVKNSSFQTRRKWLGAIYKIS